MSVDADTVRRIAHLARIAVADDEVEHLRGELNAILAFVEQLSEVDVEGVEPMTSVTPMEMKKREDVVTDGGIADDIVRGTRRRRRIIFSWCRRWWNEALERHSGSSRASGDPMRAGVDRTWIAGTSPAMAAGLRPMCLACEEQACSTAA